MGILRKIRLIIAAPLIGIVGFFLCSKGVSDYNTSNSLKAEGVEVPGKVVDSRTTTGRKGSKNYYVTVSYSAKAGESPISHEFSVTKATFENSQQVPDVQVRILPSDPNVAQLVGEEETGYFFIALGIGAIVVSLVLFFQIFKRDTPPAPMTPTG